MSTPERSNNIASLESGIPQEKALEKSPLYIIGNEDIILGFKALGFKTYAVKNGEEFKLSLEEITKSDASICLVQEDLYLLSKSLIDSYSSLPLTIFIPFSQSSYTELLDNAIKNIRLRATGTI